MLVIFYGTSAELIKLLGIVRRIPRTEQLLICTAQQREGLRKVHAQLGIEADIYLADGWRGQDVATMKQMLAMMVKVHLSFIRQYRAIKKRISSHDQQQGTKSIVMVHGDTLTTVVGAYFGHFLGLPVAHVEAGLRSGTWKNPFPEELDRRIAAKFARVHFAPNDLAYQNLTREHVKGEIISTQFNTAKDAIEMSDQFVGQELGRLKLPKRYGLVLLHRTELLENRHDLESTLRVISKYVSPKTPIVFTEHTTTREKIQAYGLQHYLQVPGLRVIPKQPYFDFMTIVRGADYIVTDGGGLQEDAFFFGIPTMVHRRRTERNEGLGLNADISKMDMAKLAAFLNSHKDKKDFVRLQSKTSPSEIIIDYLVKHQYLTSD